MPEISTRRATPTDEPFLREMLFEAPFVPPGADPLPRLVEGDPELAHYVEGYGRAGDLGIVAVAGPQPVGAAWVRQLTASDPGYGYVADDTPELTIAVAPAWRGHGVGSRLMNVLIDAAAGVVPAISLSCDPANPAMRLYERLGFVAVGESGTSITMLKALPTVVRAVTAHEVPERAPLQLRAGDVVTVGERDTEWPAFVFVTVVDGAGWVPDRHLSIDGDAGVMHTGYETTELPTVAGQRLEVLARDDLGGWLRCRAEDGSAGWVPIRTLEPSSGTPSDKSDRNSP